ncbi:MAG TPA: hypothetical protein VF017_20765 [Thermoanaerobaculia bacterium]|nr:hypothetical protein [Thermoanaerobaculia bacterium]
MDHREIVEQGWIELYRRGQLAPEAEVRFEEHFLGCPQCQQDLDLARSFQRGLQAMAAQEVARAAVGAGLAAFFARRSRLLFGVAALVALVGLSAALYLSTARNRQLASLAGELKSELDERELARRKLAQELAEGRERSERERAELAERIATLETAAATGRAATGLARPQVLSSVYLMAVVRGEEDAPAAIVDLAQTAEPITLAVPIDLDPRIHRYRLTLTDPAGRVLVTLGDLLPNPLETLLLAVPGASLGPGDHLLALDGITPDGSALPLERYRVRVVGRRP